MHLPLEEDLFLSRDRHITSSKESSRVIDNNQVHDDASSRAAPLRPSLAQGLEAGLFLWFPGLQVISEDKMMSFKTPMG